MGYLKSAAIGRRIRGGGVHRLSSIAFVLAALVAALTATAAQGALDYNFSASFGRGILIAPYGLGVDQSNGDVYIADNASSRVYKFNSSGVLLGGFGMGGSIDGSATPAASFDRPGGVAVDNSGGPSARDFYVADPFRNAVDKFDSTGRYLCQITGAGSATTSPSECDRTDPVPAGAPAFSLPAALAVDTAGNLYVTEVTNSTLSVFSPHGRYLRFFHVQPAEEDGDPSGPNGTNAVDAAGNLYSVTPTEEAQGGGVHVYTPTGAPNTTIGCPTVEVKGEHCPPVYTSSDTGELRGPGALRGPLGNPFSAAIDPITGNVVIGDNTGAHVGPTITGPGLIDLYDAAGHRLGKFGEDIIPLMGSQIFGIGVYGATHDVYAADLERGIVDIFGPPFNGPAVVTQAPTGVTESTASLNGTVNPEGHPVTAPQHCRFQYISAFDFHANGESYTGARRAPSSIACATSPGSGSSPVAETGALAGLRPGTTYHSRILASSDGVHFALGADHTFTTSTATTHPYLGSFGSFPLLAGVAVDGSAGATAGDVYAVDAQNRVVERFTASGAPANFSATPGSNVLDGSNITGMPSGPFGRPVTAAVDPANGDFYVTDNTSHVVDRFDPAGHYLSQLAPPSSATPRGPFTPFGVAVDPRKGDVYVTDSSGDPRGSNQAVDRFSASGRFRLSFEVPTLNKFGETDSIAVGAGGDIYVENRFDSVQKFDPRGRPLPVDGRHGDGNVLDSEAPQSVAVDPSSHEIYVYNNRGGLASTSSVQRYTPAGAQIDQFGNGGELIQGSAYGIAVNGLTHDFYAADINAGAVKHFGPGS